MRVLIGVLNWGLGHASRSLPIIHHLLDASHECLVASDGAALSFLRKNVKHNGVQFLELPAYRIRYDKKTVFMSLFWQLPRLRVVIEKERRICKKIVEDYTPDLIISDNRLGFFHPDCLSIFLSHQLNLKTGLRFLDPVVNMVYRRFYSRFDHIWIPDFPDALLSGTLSRTENKSREYLGPLSSHHRLKDSNLEKHPKKILIVLSGPEPKRTQFEQRLISTIKAFKGGYDFTLIRGLAGDDASLECDLDIRVFNFMDKSSLHLEMEKTDLVVARAGYSTIMDLTRLKLRGILVPTPGQPEQEYLAKHLMGKIPCVFIQEDEFEWSRAIKDLKEINHLSYPETSMLDQERKILGLVQEYK